MSLIQNVVFDDEATLALGAAFDLACGSLQHLPRADKVRELIAKRIIEAAINGEFDPIRLHSQAIFGFSIDDVSMPVVSVSGTPPVLPTLRLRTRRDPRDPGQAPCFASLLHRPENYNATDS